MSARLIYVMDPMCSWCWGFAPVAAALIAQAREAGVATRVVPGGLRTGGSALDSSTRKYILEHWQGGGPCVAMGCKAAPRAISLYYPPGCPPPAPACHFPSVHRAPTGG